MSFKDLNIVIPMAGKSSRFFEAGYKEFKYKLKINEESLFSRSLETFHNYYHRAIFHFGYLEKYVDRNFIEKELEKKGIKNYRLIDLKVDTSGQAETVFKTINGIKNDFPVVIFNIDTKRKDFILNTNKLGLGGYVEVFEGEGDHWSFIKLNENDEIIEVTEKIRVSNLCSNGMYIFKNTESFESAYIHTYSSNQTNYKETYLMPVYNYFIDRKIKVGYEIVDITEHEFFGTPNEYESLKSKYE